MIWEFFHDLKMVRERDFWSFHVFEEPVKISFAVTNSTAFSVKGNAWEDGEVNAVFLKWFFARLRLEDAERAFYEVVPVFEMIEFERFGGGF